MRHSSESSFDAYSCRAAKWNCAILITGCQSRRSRDPLAVALAKRVAARSVRGLQRRAQAFPSADHIASTGDGALLVEMNHER